MSSLYLCLQEESPGRRIFCARYLEQINNLDLHSRTIFFYICVVIISYKRCSDIELECTRSILKVFILIFFIESKENEMAYLLRCISNSLQRLGYRIEAEKCT